MEWIEITPETELPRDKMCLYGWYENGLFWAKGVAFKDEKGVLIDMGQAVKYNPTHYCIISPPKK
jgi:hypothetical protein